MKTPVAMIETFNDRYPLVGPLFWMLSVQYFIIQIVAASRWSTPFSLLHNTISDLGNTACGAYGQRLVCSPLHNWMNASFIILGISMMAGSTLIYREFPKTRLSLAGFSFMGLAGFGTLLVGLFPENTISPLHITGAALAFILGNLALIALGLTLDMPQKLRFYTIGSGIIALFALILFVLNVYLGFGVGGMERLTAYPQAIWLIVFGIYMSHKHCRLKSKTR